MKKRYFISLLIGCSLRILGQNSNHVKMDENIWIDFKDFKIEMVTKSYTCTTHPSVSSPNIENCSFCERELSRDKKLKIYVLNKNIDISKIEGRIIVVFKDGTQISRKLKMDKEYGWIKFGENAYNNYQQAVLKLKYKDKKYKETVGDPAISKGHHH